MHKIQKFKFGDRLKEVLREKGLNPYRLTELTTLSKDTVRQLLVKSMRNPRLDTILEVLDALKMNTQEFFWGWSVHILVQKRISYKNTVKFLF